MTSQEIKKLLKPILDKLKKTIKTVAEAKGFTMIVEDGSLLYAAPSLDITDAVISAVRNRMSGSLS